MLSPIEWYKPVWVFHLSNQTSQHVKQRARQNRYENSLSYWHQKQDHWPTQSYLLLILSVNRLVVDERGRRKSTTFQFQTCRTHYPNHHLIKSKFLVTSFYHSFYSCIPQLIALSYSQGGNNGLRNPGLHRTPQDSTGLHRTPQDSTGLHRTPQDSTGLHRTPQDSTGLHTPQDSTGLHRTPQDSTGLHRIHRTPQDSTGLHRTPQVPQDSTGLHRIPQRSTGLHRTPQDSTGLHRNSTGLFFHRIFHRTPQELHRIHRTPQDSTGLHRDSTGLNRTPQVLHWTPWDSTGLRCHLKFRSPIQRCH